VADPLVRLVLGEQWLDAIPLIELLALSGAGVVLQTNTGAIYQALGMPRYITLTGSVQIATLLPAIWAGIEIMGLAGVAWAYFLHTWILNITSTYFILVRNTPIRLIDAWRPCWRPALAGVLMYGLVRTWLGNEAAEGEAAAALALAGAVAVGVASYGLLLGLLWLLAGRPEGAETALWRRATGILAALRTRFGGSPAGTGGD
jgi:lipopolysaccharide exporter